VRPVGSRLGDGRIDQGHATATRPRTRSIRAGGNSASTSSGTPAKRRALAKVRLRQPDERAFRGGSANCGALRAGSRLGDGLSDEGVAAFTNALDPFPRNSASASAARPRSGGLLA